MSLFMYCQSCGSKNVYVDSKPNFCGSCGFSFKGIAAKSNIKTKVKKPKYVEPDEEVEEEDNVVIPEINKLKFKKEEYDRGGVKFQDIAFTKTPGSNNDDDFKRAPLKATAKDILSRGANSGKSTTIGGEGSDE